jgi:hypothetical protein
VISNATRRHEGAKIQKEFFFVFVAQPSNGTAREITYP